MHTVRLTFRAGVVANRQLTIFHGGTRSPLFRFLSSFSGSLESSLRESFGELPSCSSTEEVKGGPLEASRGAVESTIVSSIESSKHH